MTAGERTVDLSQPLQSSDIADYIAAQLNRGNLADVSEDAKRKMTQTVMDRCYGMSVYPAASTNQEIDSLGSYGPV